MTEQFEQGRQRAITMIAQLPNRPATMRPREWMDHPQNAPLHTEHPEVVLGYKLVRHAVFGTVAELQSVIEELRRFQ